MESFLHIPSPSTYFCFHSVICLHSAAISLTISSPSQYFDLPLKICREAMAKLVLLFALFVLPAIAVAARPTRHPLVVKGKVYCDPCRAGFETSASTFIAGAKVKVECRHRQLMKVLYTREAATDSSGTYVIPVSEDHEDQLCDAMLVSSPHPTCRIPSEGRDKTRIILTRYNGMAMDNRFANNMGFMTNQPMAGCTQILQQYQELDD